MTQKLKPLSIVYNEKSGFHASKNDEVYEALLTLFSNYHFEIQVFEMQSHTQFDDLMTQVMQRHHNAEEVGVVVAAGG